MSFSGAAVALSAFVATRLRMALFRDRTALEAWQARRLAAWLNDEVGRSALSALPIVDRATLMTEFENHNRLGLSAAEATAIAEGRRHSPPGYHVGLSTGTTSGLRMPYVISDRERFVWLGTILAKTLGFAVLRRPRVAVALPRGSALYDAAGDGHALSLCFVSLAEGFDTVRVRLEACRPDVIVAPPRLLTWLASRRSALKPHHLVSAAEILDPPDRDTIRAGFPNARLGEVYMATEGLFATACAEGRLHLAEDCVHFELEDAGGGTVEPIITDFTRRVQRMARYRTGDLLRVADCECGAPTRAIVVAGRRADRIGGHAPDALRDAILAHGVNDFRLVQTRNESPVLSLAPGVDAEPPRAALEVLLQRPVILKREALAPPEDVKLRRVMRAP